MADEDTIDVTPGKPGLRRRLQNLGDDYLPRGNWFRFAAVVGVLYAVLVIVVGFIWSIAPAPFDVREKAAELTPAGRSEVTGAVTTATLIGVVDTLLEKPGGFLYNDRMPPGLYLDNMPHWEYGVLLQSRDLGRAMREVLSRSQSQSREDPDLAIAEPRLNFQTDSWLLPPSESEYRKGLKHFQAYLDRLVSEEQRDARFYARADNLREWLSMVNARLGSLSQRLVASVGQRRLTTNLAGDAGALQATVTPGEVMVRTPWMEIDDVFYEARGSAWALIHFLRAAEIDFVEVLENKNARVSLQQIIRELEGTQAAVWSPFILNGTGFGLLANHSLVMASYLARANAAIIDLRNLLSQG
ncbi:DUF2333 family protein [Pseudohaliea rubra]|uniref:DUF2333 family protein n=1 Tax=Pseudohaliea rubra DSM 19751 TaxID=1265313 RepID=A0A095VNY9_9GAMM|nr:DUF2333 family protein [Pseudohaliea rubra]KGE02838.1 hypothetical protein HRUBRA_02565 [Pseudohaliea rubra DSM 19751]